MARFTGDRLETAEPELAAETDAERLIAAIDEETSAVVVQYPDILGRIADLEPIAEAAHSKGALLIAVVTEPVALGLIKSPGEMGADIVVGEGQSIGVGLQFGGPYVGLFACAEKFVRQMPGRLAGETVDAEGQARLRPDSLDPRAAYPPREGDQQHLHQFGPLRARFHRAPDLAWREGAEATRFLNHARACEVADRLTAIPGVELVNDSFFNEFTLQLPVEARPAVHAMVERECSGECRSGGSIRARGELGTGW
jgi:glycine dehydrogenase subunit 1